MCLKFEARGTPASFRNMKRTTKYSEKSIRTCMRKTLRISDYTLGYTKAKRFISAKKDTFVVSVFPEKVLLCIAAKYLWKWDLATIGLSGKCLGFVF